MLGSKFLFRLSYEEERIVFYANNAEYFAMKNVKQILDLPDFHKDKTTVLFIHGFTGNVENVRIKNLLSAYKLRGDYNVLAVDWSDKAQMGYFTSALPNTIQVGENIAEYLLDMAKAGLDLNQLHIVGHSLGGQMAGIIGRKIQQMTSGETVLNRITALDPSLPGFALSERKPISKTDAKIVEVIHTDAGYTGMGYECGTVDFWPNSGYAPQPGCSRLLIMRHKCSHTRALEFWTESINNSNATKFFALKAKSWKDFLAGDTEPFDKEVAMGPDLSKNITGNYYLKTNAAPPYARGQIGVLTNRMLRNTLKNTVAPTDVSLILIFFCILIHLLLIGLKRH